MIEGAMRHGTTMDVEANYTDSHDQSEIGFGITRLLNFDLLPAYQADQQGEAVPAGGWRAGRLPAADRQHGRGHAGRFCPYHDHGETNLDGNDSRRHEYGDRHKPASANREPSTGAMRPSPSWSSTAAAA
ncbi:hypothetical protein GCM10010176_088470 [Nonomuraea spiralis]|nr:hypothetical protein GCM10010176_088470 [Nonomuraea spiralis]